MSRVVPAGELLNEAVKTASKIASMSKPIASLVKDAVNAAYETTLSAGITFERRLFHSTFATVTHNNTAAYIQCIAMQRTFVVFTPFLRVSVCMLTVTLPLHCSAVVLSSPQADQKEGMSAFVGKKAAKFTDQ